MDSCSEENIKTKLICLLLRGNGSLITLGGDGACFGYQKVEIMLAHYLIVRG